MPSNLDRSRCVASRPLPSARLTFQSVFQFLFLSSRDPLIPVPRLLFTSQLHSPRFYWPSCIGRFIGRVSSILCRDSRVASRPSRHGRPPARPLRPASTTSSSLPLLADRYNASVHTTMDFERADTIGKFPRSTEQRSIGLPRDRKLRRGSTRLSRCYSRRSTQPRRPRVNVLSPFVGGAGGEEILISRFFAGRGRRLRRYRKPWKRCRVGVPAVAGH